MGERGEVDTGRGKKEYAFYILFVFLRVFKKVTQITKIL
jgi:hypothetical protein